MFLRKRKNKADLDELYDVCRRACVRCRYDGIANKKTCRVYEIIKQNGFDDIYRCCEEEKETAQP